MEIYNVCGWVADELQDTLQPFLDKITSVTAPNLLAKIESKVNAAIGDTVTIPIKNLGLVEASALS